MAKERCSGTIETRSHSLSGQPKRRMGRIDVSKANDSVDHQWLKTDVNASLVTGMDRKSAILTEFAMEYTDSRENKTRSGDI